MAGLFPSVLVNSPNLILHNAATSVRYESCVMISWLISVCRMHSRSSSVLFQVRPDERTDISAENPRSFAPE